MNVLHTSEGGVELRFSVAKVFNNTKKEKGALILMVLVMFDNSRVAINLM